MNPQKTIIIICGPTASGKTSAAIHLAKKIQTEIISADSRQCYKELKIGVARPSEKELQEVKHHFIATHSIHEEVSAITFEKYALEKAQEIFKEKDVLIMEGGTGLYLKAFCEGLDDIPAIEPSIRQSIMSAYAMNGLDWLQEEIGKKDPRFYEQGEIKNPHRIMRALEVMEGTGRSILSFRGSVKLIRPFRIIKLGVDISRLDLLRNIDMRTDEMLKNGLIEEVKSLIDYRELTALQTVGYSEIFRYLNGEYKLEKAIELVKTHTRQYAKRQLTWFRKDGEIRWMSGEETGNFSLTS